MPRGSRRAVSEVVASLLLIMVVVVLGALVLTYSFSTFQRSHRTLIEAIMGERLSLKERFTIVDVWLHEGILSIAVYNYGDVDVTISRVYLANESFLAALNAAPTTIPAGRFRWVNVSVDGLIARGSVYRVKVSSERGVTCEVLWRA